MPYSFWAEPALEEFMKSSRYRNCAEWGRVPLFGELESSDVIQLCSWLLEHWLYLPHCNPCHLALAFFVVLLALCLCLCLGEKEVCQNPQ